MNAQQDNAFLQARRALLLDHVFFGSLIMHLNPQADSAADRGIWVDGKSIGFNMETLNDVGLSAGAGLLAKGVMQCALGHHVRRGDRDAKLWNQASDYVVNPEIIDSLLELPPGYLCDPQYRGKSVEQVYDLLKEEQDDGKDQNKDNSGGAGSPPPAGSPPATGEVRDLPGNTPGQQSAPSEKSRDEREWKITMQQAMQNALSRGDLPEAFKRLIEKELLPRTSWKEELRRFMQNISKDDSSWSRANRRFIGQGIYLPSVRSERMGHVVIAIDTSGSIGGRVLDAFSAEVKALIEDTKPEQVHILYCDARVHRADSFDGDDALMIDKLDPVGGGGTAFEPVFKWIDENTDGVPACLIYLTDMYGSFPKTEPEYPVIWGSVGTDTAPFGEVINIDISQD